MGRTSEEFVLPMSQGMEVSPPWVSTRPGGQEPAGEETVLERVFFIRDTQADASAARILGEGDLPCSLHRERGDMRSVMRNTGLTGTA
jgi:hypothetical protein